MDASDFLYITLAVGLVGLTGFGLISAETIYQKSWEYNGTSYLIIVVDNPHDIPSQCVDKNVCVLVKTEPPIEYLIYVYGGYLHA